MNTREKFLGTQKVIFSRLESLKTRIERLEDDGQTEDTREFKKKLEKFYIDTQLLEEDIQTLKILEDSDVIKSANFLYEAFQREPDKVLQWTDEKISRYLEHKTEPKVSVKRKTTLVTQVTTISDLKNIIKKAATEGTQVRAVGSGHSRAESIYTDPGCGVNIELTSDDQNQSFRKFKILKKGRDKQGKFAIVQAGAGCHIGVDPEDPASKEKNSLAVQLTKNGYSLPIVGGITHQAIGGFIQTGSAGGSTQYGFVDCIESFKFVNGKGEECEAKRGTDSFNAVGVSMGLMGVITEVTLKVRKKYNVIGSEEIKSEAESWLKKINQDKYPFEDIINQKEYAHVDWFPQDGVNTVTQWFAERDYHKHRRQPYKNILDKRWASCSAAAIFWITNKIRCKPDITDKDLKLVARLFSIFVSPSEAVTFYDIWYKGLATENTSSVDSLLRTFFTEIWFPVEQTTKVIDILKDLYKDPKVALGNYSMEMYSAHASPFWMSPAYERNVIRIDPLWWAFNSGDPADFFKYFWDAMLCIEGARVHWGKYVPKYGQICGDIIFDLNYLKDRYPKFESWLEIRNQMDPNQVFVNQYWRDQFQIKRPLKLNKTITEEKYQSSQKDSLFSLSNSSSSYSPRFIKPLLHEKFESSSTMLSSPSLSASHKKK